VLVRNQLADHGFQVRPEFADTSGMPDELAQYFEPWRLSLIVVSDGTDRFYRFAPGDGWMLNFVRFTRVPEDIQITLGDIDEDPAHPGEALQINYLAPGTQLRSVIVTDHIEQQPGINAALGITTPSGERLWSVQLLFPLQTA